METLYNETFLSEYNNYGIPIFENQPFHERCMNSVGLEQIPEEYKEEIPEEYKEEIPEEYREEISDNQMELDKLKLRFENIKNQAYIFNEKTCSRLISSIDKQYEKEVQKCLNELPTDFKPARGRGRALQLKNLNPRQREIESRLRLIKNKYSAKKTRAKKKELLLKSESQTDFLKNKIKKYEKIIGELFSKIK